MSESTKETSDRGTTPAGEPRAAQAAGSPEARKVVEGSIWTTGVLLVVALVGLINYLGMKYYHRFDWTGSKLYSLSEKTLSVVSVLDQDVDVTLFIQPTSNVYDATRELLERYASASPRIELRTVDPERNLVSGLGVLALDLDKDTLPLLPNLRAQAGVIVAASATAAGIGQDALQSGDVIYAANGAPVASIAALRQVLEALPPGDPVVLQVERAGVLRYVVAERE